MTQSKIDLALAAWSWLATDPANTEPLPPLVDNDESRQLSDAFGVGDADIPIDSRRFQPAVLHKKLMSKTISRPKTDEILTLLESAGVIGSSFLDASGPGRNRELRHVSAEYLCFDNEEAHCRLETKLTEMLTKVISAMQFDDRTQELRAKAEIALTVYDWLSDPENVELDSHNAVVFSIKRLSKDIENAAEGLSVLEYRQVISKPFDEPNARRRKMAKLNQDWFKSGGRERLEKMLVPPKPEPYIQVGPLRALHDFLVVRPGSSQNIAASTIISNEPLCKFLVEGGFPVAPLNQSDASCACTIPTCRFKFKISDSTPLDHPVLQVLQDFYFFFNSTILNFRKGDLIVRPDLIAHLTGGTAHWPVVNTHQYAVCPRCRNVSRRTVLGENLATAS